MTKYIWLLVLFGICKSAATLECYDCRNVTDVAICNQTRICSTTESCYMQAVFQANTERKYTLACKDNDECHPLNSSSPLIGRSVHSPTISKRDAPCHECCSTSLCNKALCNHPISTTCVDDPSVDCAKMNSIFNVCGDIHKAKLVCQKFCKLCNLVDGNWNWWLSWSGCDVTCANGTQTRHRTCTDPAPQNGGLQCLGDGTQSKTCTLDACPIHGGWTQWSPWGSCSVTCDVGMKRRDRSCSNPYPSLGGDHCFGDSRDDQICYEPGCADGSWSSWHNWSQCSATCGTGIQERNRECSNPIPSLLGRYCDGKNVDIVTCSYKPCIGSETLFIVGMPMMETCIINYTNYSKICQLNFGAFISQPNSQFQLQTGTFTSNKYGNYWFQWNFDLTRSCYIMTCNLYKNNNNIITVFLNNTYHTHASSGVRVQLDAHDIVHFRECICPPWRAGHNTEVLNPELEIGSTFSGILMP